MFKDLPVMKAADKVNNTETKEVCLCPNGRMFAASSGTNCSTAADTCL